MLRCLLLFLCIVLASYSFAQPTRVQLEEAFKKYDVTGNGYLSGTEVTNCNCKNFDANGDGVVMHEEYLEGMGLKQKTGSNKTTRQTTTAKEQPATPAAPVQAQGDCNFDPPAPGYLKTASFSVALAKRNLYDKYNMKANGTTTAPSRVGVRFLEFAKLNPYKNTVRVEPGRGALRINDAAPPNIMIYPVKSVHIVCEEYTTGNTRYKVESEYDCFIDRYGDWVCGSSGKVPPKITQLN